MCQRVMWFLGQLALGLICWTQVQAAELTVSAAASLTNAFTEIGKEYEKARPGDRVLFNFGASGSLLQQIVRGAPVDVFASADLETMDRAQKQNVVVQGTRVNFAANKLVVIVPGSSNAQLDSLADLGDAAIRRIAVGIPESVPVGRYTKGVLEAAKLWEPLQPKMIFTQNVRQSLDYVARGETDAGFVYATDARIAQERVRVALEVPTADPILYPIAAVKGNGQERQARDFVQFVQSERARQILEKYGFGPP
ncbi:MAG: molybdate ABC transporter substrate-binding protein [Burkholderiales bacterium]|nr:molybdate ABC transporter substrate-binding protein [Burkholderiales bacterium]MCW5621664.1 molybdate ABC transporter substrate-binding protein [Burkholderiales bacterium]